MRPLVLAILLALGVSGCGFTPLYGTPGVASGLTAIQVSTPEGRVGALLREHLDDVLGHNGAVPPTYRLTTTLGEQRYPRGIRIDNVATRYEYVLVVDYALTPVGGNLKAARTGKVRVEVTYDSADQPYASVAAQQDAQNRATGEAARRIELELATWFARPGT